MSEHDIADCPRCKQRDYILKEDNIWICLNCGHTSKMPKSKFDSEDNPDMFSTLVALFLIAVVLIVALGNGRLVIIPNQNINRELLQQTIK